VWILVCFLFCREVMGAAALCVKLYSLIYHVQLLCEYWFVFFFCRELMGCSLVCQAGINWYTMCSYCVLVQCETCICFLFCRENWWKMLPCLLMLLMLFIAVKMIVSAIVCKWVLNIVSATVCMGASVWNLCMCYCNCCLSCWICHWFLEYMLLSLVQLLLKFIYINCVYFVRCQLNLQLLFLEYNLSCFLDDFGIC
jgi:hypothetical protein